jgi:hypothetical protein
MKMKLVEREAVTGMTGRIPATLKNKGKLFKIFRPRQRKSITKTGKRRSQRKRKRRLASQLDRVLTMMMLATVSTQVFLNLMKIITTTKRRSMRNISKATT